jgi:hypothetical protein
MLFWPPAILGLTCFATARKELEESFEEEEEEEDAEIEESILNLQDNDGMILVLVKIFPSANDGFTEDVWDEDSAYLEMLAAEVGLVYCTDVRELTRGKTGREACV